MKTTLGSSISFLGASVENCMGKLVSLPKAGGYITKKG
jgi:hypothetical protein